MDVEKLADKARNSISSFCMNECKSYCCRKGYLIVNDKQIATVTAGNEANLLKNKSLKLLPSGDFSVDLNNGGCPSLKDNKCIIHKHKDRPKTCQDFPIFIEGKKIGLSGRCPAVQQRKFYPYILQFLEKGYIVKESSCFDKTVNSMEK
tara:strand:- start:3320 stop:3766 length:447 start_codon:yes stop_codon:yes gene_type:complete